MGHCTAKPCRGVNEAQRSFETRGPLIALETPPWYMYLSYPGITILTLTGENLNFKRDGQSSQTKIFRSILHAATSCYLHGPGIGIKGNLDISILLYC